MYGSGGRKGRFESKVILVTQSDVKPRIALKLEESGGKIPAFLSIYYIFIIFIYNCCCGYGCAMHIVHHHI